MPVQQNDGFGDFQRPESGQKTSGEFGSFQVGVVTRVVTNKIAYVRIPAINGESELGPYTVVSPLQWAVTVAPTTTIPTYGGTPATVTGSQPVTGSGTGVYGVLETLTVGTRVLVALIDGSLDEAAILGKL